MRQRNYVEKSLDLNDICIRHILATYFVRAEGETMTATGILSGELHVFNKAETFGHGDIAFASDIGEFTVKELCTYSVLCLQHMNPAYPPIYMETDNLEIFGVFIHTLHTFCEAVMYLLCDVNSM